MPRTWPGFKKRCKVFVKETGKCDLKISNDFCEEDCPAMSFAKRALKKKIKSLHKKYSKYDWSGNHIVLNLLDALKELERV